MPEPEVVTQGANAGEPQGAAAGSGLSDEEWLSKVETPEPSQETKPAGDEEFFTRLRSMDWDKVPADIRQKAEAPFLSQYTRRFQEVSDRERQLLNKLTSGLESKGIQPSQDQKAELLERIRQGDFDALGSYVDKAVNERINPVAQQVAMRAAVEQAEAMNPYVRQRAQDIVQVIQNDPVAAELVQRDNFKYAAQVFDAVATKLQVQELQRKLEGANADRLAIERAAVERYKRSARELPPTTSRAGTTQHGASGGGGEAKTFAEAAEMTLKQMGWK